eukprot:1140377-Pelagomonas_calceolata.AAC.13
MGIWRVFGSTRLHNLAAKRRAQCSRFHQHPKGWCEEFCINEFAEVCMLPLCRLQLLSKPRVFTVLDFSANAAGLHSTGGVASRRWLLWPSVQGCVCCEVISIASGRLEVILDLLGNFLRKRDLKVVLRQPITTPYVHVYQACPPRAFVKSFDDRSSSNIVAISFHAGDDMTSTA